MEKKLKRKIFTILLVLGLLAIPTAALANGDFTYLLVKRHGITGEIILTNPALTTDFFAFADFTQGEVTPPADPGQGYDIVRIYIVDVDGKPTAQAFDQLLYFPYTDAGYVYYVAVAEGTSEYTGKWFAANPSADEPFRAVLAERARLNWIPFAVLIVILGGFFIAYYRKPKQA